MDTPLYNKQYESIVLGTIIRNNEFLSHNDDILCDDLFYDDCNKVAFRCIRELYERDGVIKPALLAGYAEEAHHKELDIMFFTSISGMCDTGAFSACLNHLDEYRKRRKLWADCQKFCSLLYDMTEPLDKSIEDLNNGINSLSSGETEGIRTAKELLKGVIDMAQANMNTEMERGVMTGFKVFDEVCGWHRGQLITIAAMSGIGKTSLALNIATHQAINGVGVAYYSLEMQGEELMARILSSVSKVPSSDILYRPLGSDAWGKLDKTIGQLGDLPIYVDERSTTTFERTCRSIREMVAKRNIKVAYIDYLQIYMSSEVKGDSDEKLMATMARGFKNLAKELGIIIVILSQISRSREDNHPKMNRMRGSGQIQEASDMVLLIDRPEGVRDWLEPQYEGFNERYSVHHTALLKLTKGRNTGENEVMVMYSPETTTFYDSMEIPLKDSYKVERTEDEERKHELTSGYDENQLPF